MFELFLLGSPRIEGKEGRLTGEPAQRHRLALLALLATARDATLPREKVMVLLWPERGDRDARHLLNVSLHVLRKALGEEVLRTEGDALRLDTERVNVDVVRFRTALQRGEEASALASYGGRFLDGFYLDDAPDFDQWLESERGRINGEYLSALEQSANRAEASGDWTNALRWCEAVVAQVPDRPRAVVRLMRALEATGDRVGALRAADTHIALLANEYGAEPSPEVIALAARMRMQPTEVADLSAAPPVQSENISNGASLTSAPSSRRRSYRWFAVAVIVIVASFSLFSWRPWMPSEEPSVAVLPFLDLSPGKDRTYLSDGLTDEILNALAKVPGLRVASRSSAFQFRDAGVDVREVGRRLGVGAIVEGSVRIDSNRLRVTAQLIETKGGYHLWSQNYDRSIDDVLLFRRTLRAL